MTHGVRADVETRKFTSLLPGVRIPIDANPRYPTTARHSHDGKFLFLHRRGPGVDALGPLRMAPGDFKGIDLQPDGTRIVASTQHPARYELWTRDNLMTV